MICFKRGCLPAPDQACIPEDAGIEIEYNISQTFKRRGFAGGYLLIE